MDVYFRIEALYVAKTIAVYGYFFHVCWPPNDRFICTSLVILSHLATAEKSLAYVVKKILFVSNGEGTGVKEGWLDAQKNYAKDLRTSQVIEMDCAHYVHDFEYESISQEMKSFISELKIRPTREYFENVNKD